MPVSDQSPMASPAPVRWLSLVAALAATSCSGVQSTLDPAGPAAAAIAQTWWLMAIGASVVFALVMGLLWHTLARRGDGRQFVHGTRVIVFGGLLLPSLTLIALLAYGTAVGHRVAAVAPPADLVVQVVGRQFHWDFRYLDGADGQTVAVTTDVLVLPRGRMVEFQVTSADVIHSFWIPRLGGKIDAIPGRVNPLRLRVDRAGPITGQCAEFCGREHAHMRFDVLALPPAQFDRWLAAGGAQPPPRARAELQTLAEPLR